MPNPPAPPASPPALPAADWKIEIEEMNTELPKRGYPEFTADGAAPPAIPKHYLEMLESVHFNLKGGTEEQPESPINGSRHNSVDPLTGQVATNDMQHPGNDNMGGNTDYMGPTLASGTSEGSGYDDEPNRKADQKNDRTYTKALANENTTESLISNAKSKLEPYQNTFTEGTPLAYRDLAEDETHFSYSKVQFRIKWPDGTAEESRYPVNFLLIFEPEDDPDTQENESEAQLEVIRSIQLDAQSTTHEIDPDTERSGEDGRYYLVPVEIAPDWNRDGKINQEDRGKVTEISPWRWWINDDNDIASAERGNNAQDIPKQSASKRDCNDLSVDGMRDLVDFFSLHLDLKNALELLPVDDYKYVLKHEEEALKFFEYPACIIDGSDEGHFPNRHVKRVVAGRGNASKELKLASSQGTELSTIMLSSIKDGKGVVIMEGAKKTEKPLILEIIKKSDGSSVAQIDFPIRIVDVEDMYRHVNMRYLTGGSRGNATQTGEPSGYTDELTNGKYIACIHGYYVSADSARGSQSNIFKRLHHLGNKARFVGVSWFGDPPNPSNIASLPPDYHRAVYNGLTTGIVAKDHLAFTQESSLTVLAHSLGNSVSGNAIANHGLQVEHYFIINGAIPLQAYDSSQTSNSSGHADMNRNMSEDDWKPFYDYANGEQQRLFAANWHELFAANPSDNRNKLTWKQAFASPQLLSVAYNFYSPSDEVVENPDTTEQFGDWGNLWDSAHGGRHTWVQQEIAKGGQHPGAGLAFHELNGGWNFNLLDWHTDDGDQIPRVMYPSEAAASISDEMLKIAPFHRRLVYNDIYNSFDPNADPDLGSNTAGDGSVNLCL